MTIEEMQNQIESMMPTPKQIVESIDKKLEEKRLVMKLIDKSALVAEISKRIKGINRLIDTDYNDKEKFSLESVLIERIHTYEVILDYIDTLEVKEVDLEKELIEWHKEHFKKDGTFIGMSGFYLTNNSQVDIAKHFFELGLKAQKGE